VRARTHRRSHSRCPDPIRSRSPTATPRVDVSRSRLEGVPHRTRSPGWAQLHSALISGRPSPARSFALRKGPTRWARRAATRTHARSPPRGGSTSAIKSDRMASRRAIGRTLPASLTCCRPHGVSAVVLGHRGRPCRIPSSANDAAIFSAPRPRGRTHLGGGRVVGRMPLHKPLPGSRPGVDHHGACAHVPREHDVPTRARTRRAGGIAVVQAAGVSAPPPSGVPPSAR
jgi:hypothetical protein